MPNDLPDWATIASLPSGTLTLSSAQSTLGQTIALPTRAPACVLDVLTNSFTSISVAGHTSGELYLSLIGPLVGPHAVIITDGRDASVDISVGHTMGGNTDVVDVSFFPIASVSLSASGSVTDVSDRVARQLGVVQSIVTTVTVQEGNAPPLWQAPSGRFQAQVTTTGNFQLVGGNIGQVIRVFDWELETDQGSGFTIAFINDSDAAVAGRMAALVANNGQITGYKAGTPLASGKGLQLEVAAIGAGAQVRCFGGFSQG